MIPINIRRDLNAGLERLERHSGRSFSELIKVAGLDPRMDLIDADLRFQDFSNQDLDGFDFTRSNVIGSNFDNAKIQGAVFDSAKADVTALRRAADWELVDKVQFDRDLAIWFGDRRVKVYVKNVGLVLDQPTLIAIKSGVQKKRIHAFGEDAESLQRTHSEGFLYYAPIVNGLINDFDLASLMLSYILQKVLLNTSHPPNTIVSVPTSTTDSERRAIEEAILNQGARSCNVVDQPVATGVGLGLPVEDPGGNMLMEIGQTVSEVAVLSDGGQVYSRSVRLGLDSMLTAIQEWSLDRHGVLVSRNGASKIFDAIASAEIPKLGTGKSVHFIGREPESKQLKEVQVTTLDIAERLQLLVSEFVEAIELSLEAMPPEFAAEIIDRGLVITGTGASLRDLDKVVSGRVRMPVSIAQDVENSGISGTAYILENWSFYENMLA